MKSAQNSEDHRQGSNGHDYGAPLESYDRGIRVSSQWHVGDLTLNALDAESFEEHNERMQRFWQCHDSGVQVKLCPVENSPLKAWRLLTAREGAENGKKSNCLSGRR